MRWGQWKCYPRDSYCVVTSAAAALCGAKRFSRVYSGGGLAELVADISCELTISDLPPVQCICYNLALLPSAVPPVPRSTLALLIFAGGFSAPFSSGLACCPFSRDREVKLLAWNHTEVAEYPGRISRLDGLWCFWSLLLTLCRCEQSAWRFSYG